MCCDPWNGPAMITGSSIRRMRRLRNMKQAHLAEVLGVTQATVSRWESGAHEPDPEQATKLEALLSVPLDSLAHAALRRLIEAATIPVHLVCDATHRLLAASPARETAWGVSAQELRGQSLWCFASDELREVEGQLRDVGWYDTRSPAVSAWTNDNGNALLHIVPQLFLWERMVIDDGTVVRIDSACSLESLQGLRPDVKMLSTGAVA
jgi:transcriptional regulator with XRE-family HTH domain